MDVNTFDQEVGLLRHEGASSDDVAASPFHAGQEIFVTFGEAIAQVMSEDAGERWRYEITGDNMYVTGQDASEIAQSDSYRAWADKRG